MPRRPLVEPPRRPKTDFRQYVQQAEAHHLQLPLTHVTDAYDLRDIVLTKQIQTTTCPVFRVPLIYCFHARPSFRKNPDAPANSLKSYAPVAFLLDAPNDQAPRQVYPFDTGAFQAKLYNDILHVKMHVEDFALEANTSSAGRMIACFFGSEAAYYDREPLRNICIPSDEFEAASYHELISFRGKNKRDDRASAIEIAYSKAIAISTSIKAAILPASLLDSPKTGKALSSLGISIIPYRDGEGFEPSDQIPRLYDIARDYYVRMKWL